MLGVSFAIFVMVDEIIITCYGGNDNWENGVLGRCLWIKRTPGEGKGSFQTPLALNERL